MWDKEKILSPHEELNLNNKLVEWKVPIDGMGIDDASLKDKFLFYSFVPQTVVPRFSKLFRCEESSQTAICCLECLGRLKCLVTGLDASLSFLSTWRRSSWNWSPSCLPVPPMYNILQ